MSSIHVPSWLIVFQGLDIQGYIVEAIRPDSSPALLSCQSGIS